MDGPYFVKVPLAANASAPTPFDIVRRAVDEPEAVYLGPFAGEDEAVRAAAQVARAINDTFANSDLDWRTAVNAVLGQQYSELLVAGDP